MHQGSGLTVVGGGINSALIYQNNRERETMKCQRVIYRARVASPFSSFSEVQTLMTIRNILYAKKANSEL